MFHKWTPFLTKDIVWLSMELLGKLDFLRIIRYSLIVPIMMGRVIESEGPMVTPEDLASIVKRHGWRVEWSRRYRTRYAYAARGKKPHVTRRYLCGEYGLNDVTETQIVAKLNRSSLGESEGIE